MPNLSDTARLERSQEIRARILNCAHSRVVVGGFANLTMQALADDVGIAIGSLYRHFSGKGELAAEVFSQASRAEIDALVQIFQQNTPCAQRLAEGIAQFAARAWHSRSLAFALIAEPVEVEVDEQRLVFRELYAGLFVDLLEEGNRRDQWQIDQPQIVAACLVGAITEALVGPLSAQAFAVRQSLSAPIDLDSVCQSIVAFCLRAVGASERGYAFAPVR